MCSAIFHMANFMNDVRACTVQPTAFKPMQFDWFLFEFYFFFTVIVIAELVILFIGFLKYLLFNVIYPPNMFMGCRLFCFPFQFVQSIFGFTELHTHILLRAPQYFCCLCDANSFLLHSINSLTNSLLLLLFLFSLFGRTQFDIAWFIRLLKMVFLAHFSDAD